jgi:uncharacterized protein
MKRSLLMFSFIFFLLPLMAQDITGNWVGNLKVNSTVSLKVVFNINRIDSGYSATMDSPDQGAYGLPVSSITFENNVLTLKASGIGVSYTGSYIQGDSINGEFQQGGSRLPLVMKRETTKQIILRPQEPKAPFPYKCEEVSIENKPAGVTLAGTLTIPQGAAKLPAVILITGSGPQNRDEELFGHKLFWVIADYLTRKGIAVLRCDDRGTAGSTGDFSKATSVDFAGDVSSAIDYLKTRKEIDKKKIGLCGHSEGGVIASMLASKRKDVDFIVLMASPGMLKKVECQVLALNGSKDLQVPAKENLTLVKAALDKVGNNKVTIREYPGLNHLFQNCKTGLPVEYDKIDETISPKVLEDIAAWILKQTK